MSGVAPDPRVLALCIYANGTWWALEDDDPAVERQAALAEVARAARDIDMIYEGLRTDENDGEFALWSEDQLVVALHALRPALEKLK